MGLESGTYISDLVATNPPGSDPKSDGDGHIRLIKSTIKATFPNVNGAISSTDEELSELSVHSDSVTVTNATDIGGTVYVRKITSKFWLVEGDLSNLTGGASSGVWASFPGTLGAITQQCVATYYNAAGGPDFVAILFQQNGANVEINVRPWTGAASGTIPYVGHVILNTVLFMA